ncbi:lysylphosphatidylglycerol synthase transmembrane domain-containing protein [Candidatus Omnitrophota bacterium]
MIQKPKRHYISILLRTILLCVLLFLIVRIVNFRDFIDILSNAAPIFVICVLCACVVDLMAMGAKWTILLRVFGIRVSPLIPILAYFTGRGFSFFVPSTIGIDSYKTYFMVRHSNGTVVPVISSILVERFIGMFSSFGMISLLMPFSIPFIMSDSPPSLWIAVPFFFFGVCALLYLLLHLSQYGNIRSDKLPFLPSFVSRKLAVLLKTLSCVTNAKKSVFLYFFVSIFEKTLYGTAVYFSLRAIGYSFPYLAIIGVIPILSLLERLPISFSSIGIREGLFVAVFSLHGLSGAESLSVAVIIRCVEVFIVVTSLLLWYASGLNKESREELATVNEKVTHLYNEEDK